MKKAVAILLVGVMSIGLFTGCGSKKVDPTGKADVVKEADKEVDKADVEKPKDEIKPVKLSMLYSDNATYPYQEDWLIWDIIEEHTGVTFDVQPVPESDYEVKRQMVLNSGDIPDIITKTFAKPEDAMAGLLLPISEYEDQMPNYKAWIEKYEKREELDNTRLSDGNYYSLPVKARKARLQDHQWLVRTDILEKNNIPIPTNLDELHDAGVKLKEIYPNSTPITNRFGSGNIMTGFGGAFGTIAGWNLGNGAYYDRDNDVWEFAPTTDKWKNMLAYVNKLYESGVLDPEFTTLDSTVYEQRIVGGDTFLMLDWTANIHRYNLQGKENDPDYNVTPVFPIEGADGNYAIGPKASWEQAWVFPASVADEDYFDQLLSFIDWCYTDEAEVLLTFGIEGDTYVEKDGVLKYKDDNIDYNATAGVDNNSLAVRQHLDSIYSVLTPEQIGIFEQVEKEKLVPLPNPQSPLSPDEIEGTKIYTSTLTDYANSMMEKFIYGKESLDNWDDFVKACEEGGSTDLIELYNKAWSAK